MIKLYNYEIMGCGFRFRVFWIWIEVFGWRIQNTAGRRLALKGSVKKTRSFLAHLNRQVTCISSLGILSDLFRVNNN